MGIQHEKVRKLNGLNDKYELAHGKLHADYKAGLITKEQHKNRHKALWSIYQCCFHTNNMSLPLKDRLDIREYEEIYDDNQQAIGTKTDNAIEQMKSLPVDDVSNSVERFKAEDIGDSIKISEVENKLTQQGVLIR